MASCISLPPGLELQGSRIITHHGVIYIADHQARPHCNGLDPALAKLVAASLVNDVVAPCTHISVVLASIQGQAGMLQDGCSQQRP